MSNQAMMPGSTARGLRARGPPSLMGPPCLKAATPTENTPKNVTSHMSTRRRPGESSPEASPHPVGPTTRVLRSFNPNKYPPRGRGEIKEPQATTAHCRDWWDLWRRERIPQPPTTQTPKTPFHQERVVNKRWLIGPGTTKNIILSSYLIS